MTEEVNEIYQPISKVGSYAVEVVSGRGNFYNVKLSDRVAMIGNLEVGDTAVIKTFEEGWLVTDIIKRESKDKYYTEYESEDACFSDDMVNRLKVRRKLLIRETRRKVWELEQEIKKEEEKELERQMREFDEIFGDY